MVDLSVFVSLSSLSEIPDQRKDKKPMNNTLLELSMFHQKIRNVLDVHFILEVTSSVSLRSAPPFFPKGFQKIFENFGGTDGNVFTLPFCGQHSCFSTSSGELKRASLLFLKGVMRIASCITPLSVWVPGKKVTFAISTYLCS